MNDWLGLLREALAEAQPAVAVTVAAVRGSAPREAGALMVVNTRRIFGSIGGGHLEHTAIEAARAALVPGAEVAEGGWLTHQLLGEDLGQCCGGRVWLHYEYLPVAGPRWLQTCLQAQAEGRGGRLFLRRVGGQVEHRLLVDGEAPASLDAGMQAASAALPVAADWPPGRDLLWPEPTTAAAPAEGFMLVRPLPRPGLRAVVFGAGHVGQALVRVLQPLAERITWCDARGDLFPADPPRNLICEAGDPFAVIAAQPPGVHYLIMTHSHSLDMILCEAVLRRRDAAYCGLIGSLSKRRRFEKLLRDEGLRAEDLARLTCPIGIDGIESKQPAAIAVAVAAQLLQSPRIPEA